MGQGAIEAVIAEDGSIELLGLGSDELRNPRRGPYRLAAGSLAWPGISVLALKPVDSHGDVPCHALRIAVLRSDLDVDDARHLHRLMLWSLHGGATATA